MTADDLILAWRTNNRINLQLIAELPEAALRVTLSTRGGRDVGGQFAHLHNVRVCHLERRAKKLLNDLQVFPTEARPSRAQLESTLTASAEAIEQYLAGMVAGEKGINGPKRGPVQALAYFIAHESHHRGNILLTLKQCGQKVDQKVRYAIWEWDRI